MKSRLGRLLQRASVKLLGYSTTDYGRGYSDGWKAGAAEAVRKETVDELIASVSGAPDA